MNKYKVEFEQTETFVIDVLAKDMDEAREKATKRFSEVKQDGMEHYHMIDSEWNTSTVYDVTNTDDPFNP